MSDERPPYELRSNEDGDLCLVLTEGVDPEGWSVTTLHRDGARSPERREGPGWFGYVGEVAAWWSVDRMDAAHVEVSDPAGIVTVLHHLSFPPDDCWACGSAERELGWRVLQDHWDAEPYGVMAWDPATGLLYRYIAGEGLVHWPSLADHIFKGEPGSRPISQREALRLIEENVGRVNDQPFDIERFRGDAPTPTSARGRRVGVAGI